MTTIYLYCLPKIRDQKVNPNGKSVQAYAISEDGVALVSRVSDDANFAKHDLGLTSDKCHDKYKKYFPGGYELEWIVLPKHHAALALALERNTRRAMAGDVPDKPKKWKGKAEDPDQEIRNWKRDHEVARKEKDLE